MDKTYWKYAQDHLHEAGRHMERVTYALGRVRQELAPIPRLLWWGLTKPTPHQRRPFVLTTPVDLDYDSDNEWAKEDWEAQHD